MNRITGIIALLVFVSLVGIGCGSGSSTLVAGDGIIITEIDGGLRISVDIEEGEGISVRDSADDAVIISLAEPEPMDIEQEEDEKEGTGESRADRARRRLDKIMDKTVLQETGEHEH